MNKNHWIVKKETKICILRSTYFVIYFKNKHKNSTNYNSIKWSMTTKNQSSSIHCIPKCYRISIFIIKCVALIHSIGKIVFRIAWIDINCISVDIFCCCHFIDDIILYFCSLIEQWTIKMEKNLFSEIKWAFIFAVK